MKPTLKKVSKYENKFAKLQKKAAEFNFRNQLKQVKKKEFTLEEEDKEVRTTVFNRIFLSRRREYFFAKLFFSCPSKVYSKRSLNLTKKKKNCAHRSSSRNFLFAFIYIFPNVHFNFHLEFVYLSCTSCISVDLISIDKFTSTFLNFARDATFYSHRTGRRAGV